MLKEKLTDRHGGVNRLVAILLVLVGVMLIVIVFPAYRRSRESAAQLACSIALDKAQDMMSEEYLFNSWSLTTQEAAAVVDRSRYARDNLCPDGGDYFIIRQGDGIGYKVVCGLHDSDSQERTRLCSGAVMSRLLEALQDADPDAKTITVLLNGKKLVCQRVDADPGLMYGTKFDIDRKDIVCYYALNNGDLPDLKDGDMWYFGYADEQHASVWKYGKGWSGDAWNVR